MGTGLRAAPLAEEEKNHRGVKLRLSNKRKGKLEYQKRHGPGGAHAPKRTLGVARNPEEAVLLNGSTKGDLRLAIKGGQ